MKKYIIFILILLSVNIYGQFSKDKLFDSNGIFPPDKVQHFFKGAITFTVSYSLNQDFWKGMKISFVLATLWEFLNAVGITDDPDTILKFTKKDTFSYKDITADILGAVSEYLTIKFFELIYKGIFHDSKYCHYR